MAALFKKLNGKSIIIKKTKCPTAKRLDFLPRFVGNKYLEYERGVFDLMRRACPDYNGGYWEYYRLSNGGFYISLHSDKLFKVEQPSNFYKGRMSADAVSIGINLYLLCEFAWQVDQEHFTEAFNNLRDFAKQHPEWSEIFHFID